MIAELSAAAKNFNWLLNRFVDETANVRHAVAVSVDGLLLAGSTQLNRQGAEHLAALTAGLMSLTRGAADSFQLDGVNQIIVEMGKGYLFITSISRGSMLGVLAESDCEMGSVAYEMTLMANEASRVLTPELIIELKNPIQF